MCFFWLKFCTSCPGACAHFMRLYILFNSIQFISFHFYSIQRDEKNETLRMITKKTNENEKNENYEILRKKGKMLLKNHVTVIFYVKTVYFFIHLKNVFIAFFLIFVRFSYFRSFFLFSFVFLFFVNFVFIRYWWFFGEYMFNLYFQFLYLKVIFCVGCSGSLLPFCLVTSEDTAIDYSFSINDATGYNIRPYIAAGVSL